MVSLILLIIFVGDIEHDFGFTVDVILTLSLALIIVLEEWVTETYITPIAERLLQKIITFWRKVTSSAYIAFRVFRLLMRLSSSSVTKIAHKWALQRISALENRSSLKRKNMRQM